MGHQNSANVELFRSALPMILEDPASHGQFIKEVEVARLAALEIIQSQISVDKPSLISFKNRLRSPLTIVTIPKPALRFRTKEHETKKWKCDVHPDFNTSFKVISVP